MWSLQLQKAVELTQKRYPEMKRGNYAQLTDGHIKTFENILGINNVITSADDLEPYNVDWLRTVRGKVHTPFINTYVCSNFIPI
jgi:hypothetical protein